MDHLLYISGSGRSGSTMLERLLHSSPHYTAVGEFHALWRLPADEINCSCAKTLGEDPYWADILDAAGIGHSEIARLAKLEVQLARTGFIARHKFSLALLRENTEVQEFLSLQFAVYEAIAKRAGSSIIVDSSKAGPRAWLLACEPRTKILHLYRAPIDVIASWRSKKFDPGLNSVMQRLSVVKAAEDWWKVEYLARRLAKERAVAMVSYQQLCSAPQATMDQALIDAGLPPDNDILWLTRNSVQPGENYHSLNGNPDRFDQGPITVKARSVDWSRYTLGDQVAIRAAGKTLSSLYPFR